MAKPIKSIPILEGDAAERFERLARENERKAHNLTRHITIAGVGSVDQCFHCGAEFVDGAACYYVDKWEHVDLCNKCKDKHTIKKKG